MTSPLVWLSLYMWTVISAVNDAKSLINSSKGQTPLCNCHCNVNQAPQACDYAMKALQMKLDKLIALVNNTFSLVPPQPTTSPAIPVSSCKEQYDRDNLSKSQVYTLALGSQNVPVFCHMGDFGCGDGGWTLVMKTDGAKKSFHFNSPLWKNRADFNLAGGKTGFDMQETKLPTYWNTPFSKICLGMRIGHQIMFLVINKQANSLHSLIADDGYRATSLGRNKWKTLIGSQGSLQPNCNKEGFNTACTYSNGPARARIGILGNGENDCVTCDSRIGFGMGGLPVDRYTCGNEANDQGDNGEQHISTMGYILVQ